jgi:hypothetical protein
MKEIFRFGISNTCFYAFDSLYGTIVDAAVVVIVEVKDPRTFPSVHHSGFCRTFGQFL